MEEPWQNPLEILSFFVGELLVTGFETNFLANLIYLMVTVSRFCFRMKTPHRQWQNYCGWDTAYLLLLPYMLGLLTYQRNNLLWFEVSCSWHTLVACFYHFIIFKALDMDCLVICSRIFIDWLVHNAGYLHIFLFPSLKGVCPFSFSGDSFVLPRFSKEITHIWESVSVRSNFS